MSTLGVTDAADPVDNPLVPAPPPLPGSGQGLGTFVRENLFKDAKNSILTVTFGLLLAYVGYRAGVFVFANDKLNAEGELVNSWTVISSQLRVYMVGGFPETGVGYPMLWGAVYVVALALGFGTGRRRGDESPPMRPRTRLGIAAPPLLAVVVLLAMTETIAPALMTVGLAVPFVLGQRLPRLLPESVMQRRVLIITALAVLAFLLQTGFSPSNVDDFGGLLLTVNVAFISIVLCFPIGVVLALLRRSSFVLLKPIAILYIELIRGVPLISLLFMGQFAIGFFLPPGTESPPSVIRAIIMFTLFSAAYVAEIVRGGLQSVPSGQTEAGQAVGLRPLTVTRRIVLPQALRNSIPALVGQFIALLKDTTLLVIIGQFDLLGVSDPILASPAFQNQGYAPEVYAFVAFMFWVMCFSMSRASQRLETKLGVGTR